MKLAEKKVVVLAAMIAGLAACSGGSQTEYAYPDDAGRASGDFYETQETVFGEEGLTIGGGGGGNEGGTGGGSGIAVNSFLWRASLDTVSFLPLVSADPFGGVIITDWHVAPESPGERVKMQIYILDRQLRSDGLRVAVFREQRVDGQWVAGSVNERTVKTIEDSILARARELRVKSAT